MKHSKIPDEIKENVVNDLSGQNHTEMDMVDKYDISIEDAEEIMVEAGYERCELCDYWFETGEMVDENNQPLYECPQCRD